MSLPLTLDDAPSFTELYGGQPAHDRVRDVRIPHSPQLDVLEEAFTSENWIVRIYEVKKDDVLSRDWKSANAFNAGKRRKRRGKKKEEAKVNEEADGIRGWDSELSELTPSEDEDGFEAGSFAQVHRDFKDKLLDTLYGASLYDGEFILLRGGGKVTESRNGMALHLLVVLE